MQLCTMPILMLLVAGQISDNASPAHVGSDSCEEPNRGAVDKSHDANVTDVDDGDAIDPTYEVSEVCTA